MVMRRYPTLRLGPGLTSGYWNALIRAGAVVQERWADCTGHFGDRGRTSPHPACGLLLSVFAEYGPLHPGRATTQVRQEDRMADHRGGGAVFARGENVVELRCTVPGSPRFS